MPVLIAGAALWDQCLGEPPTALHPVVWIGRCINALYKLAPRGNTTAQLAFGALATALLVALSVGVGLVVTKLEPRWLAGAIELFLLASSFSQRALAEAASVVRRALTRGDIPAARAHLSWLCSRDPSDLDADALCAATISSVAENTSDSVVAPLLWYGAFGLPALLAYRVLNTMDAMVGYRGRFEYLGRVPARLDDIANLVPARATALLMLVAALLRGAPLKRAIAVLARDGRNTESPNAGIPMATMAGVLGVRLTKPGHYRLGDDTRALHPDHIQEAVGYLRWVTVLTVLVSALLRGLVT